MSRRALLTWFHARKRDLPWRENRDPYRVLVSEIMLQQTTVEAVKPAYRRFLAAFPDVQTLAAAPVEDVLAQWSGLGYYRRARSLHEAARRIAKRNAWPETADELRDLPGVGPYTAAAVASIAFHEAVPVLDGNVIRVMSRLGAVSGDPSRAAVRRKLTDLAARLVDPGEPGDSNQAMMELGATVCRPLQPLCGECPLARACEARGCGAQERYPEARPQPAPVTEKHAVFVVRDEKGRYLVERKTGKGALQGMWGFPMRGPVDGGAPHPGRRVGTARHAIMNRRLTLEIYEADRPPPADGSKRRYATAGEIRALPRSSIVEKVFKKLRVP